MEKIAVLFPLNLDSAKRYILAISKQLFKPIIITTNVEWKNIFTGAEFLIMNGSLNNVGAITSELITVGSVVAVIAGGEFSVELSEIVSTQLGLISSMNKSPKILRNKWTMREEFARFGVEQPAVIGLASSIEEVYVLSENLEYPVISKPVDMAGSWFVHLNRNKEDLQINANPIFSYTHAKATGLEFSRKCLIEEYVEGEEYSAEVIVQNGHIVECFINKKYLSNLPYFDEIGHVCGLSFDEKFNEKLDKNILAIINAAGVVNSVMHIEFRVSHSGSFNIIEAGCRIAGDRISSLVEAQYSITLEEVMVKLKLGEDVILERNTNNMFTGIRFLFNKNKALPVNVKCIEEVIFSNVRHAENLSKTHISNRVGFQIISSPNFSSLSSAIES